MVEHVLMADPVNLVRGDARCDCRGSGLHRPSRDAPGDPHLLDGLGVLDL